MSKIYYLMGKSSSGKDTLYKEVKEEFPELRTVTPYTTRPIREGERDGAEYHFVTKDDLDRFEEEGKLIELRTYHTVYGEWHYATVDDGEVDPSQADYLVIGTLESYEKMKEYYGAKRVVPLYVEVEDGERLRRALAREQAEEVPKYDEMCRRFLADKEDFSEENLKKAGITRRYRNVDKVQCLEEIKREIQHGKL